MCSCGRTVQNDTFRSDVWPITFQERRKPTFDEINNKPFSRAISITPQADLDALFTFMITGDPSGLRRTQAGKILKFCAEADVQPVDIVSRHEHPGLCTAWLDERDAEGGIRTCGKVRDLVDFEARLSKPRFPSLMNRDEGDIADAVCEASYNDRLGTVEDDEAGNYEPFSDHIDADRRLLYIANLDRCSIMALVRTVAARQASALRRCLYNYVASEPMLHINPFAELGTFEFGFDLPYYVWTTSQTHQKDIRGLRRSQDVSFMHRGKAGCPEFLHEAHISCTVTGQDNWRWSAYCLVDAYFNDRTKYTGDDIAQDQEDGENYPIDPLVVDDDANLTPRDPRDYFLRLFSRRVSFVRREWELIVSNMHDRLRDFDHDYNESLHSDKSNSNISQNLATIRELSDHVSQVRTFPGRITKRLNQTIGVVEVFLTGQVRSPIFVGSAYRELLLVNMQGECDRLQSLKKSFDGVKEHWKEIAEMLVDRRDTLATQHTINMTTRVMAYVTPIGLAAAIFSMDSKVIPILPPNWKSFLFTLLLFLAVGKSFSNPTWLRDGVLALFRSPSASIGSRTMTPKIRRRRTRGNDEEVGVDLPEHT